MDATQPCAPTLNRPKGKLAWACAVLSLISSMFLFALDNTIVANVQPSIIEALNDKDLLPWVSVSYPLGVVGLNLLQCVHISARYHMLIMSSQDQHLRAVRQQDLLHRQRGAIRNRVRGVRRGAEHDGADLWTRGVRAGRVWDLCWCDE